MQRSENFVIAFVLALLGCYWFKMTMDLPQTATTTLYGPRFFPQLILGGLFLCIVLFLWKGIRQMWSKSNRSAGVNRVAFMNRKVIILFLFVLGYIFLFERIGFCLSSILYIILAQLLFGIRSKFVLFLISPGVIIVLNMLFVIVFKIPVP